MTAVNRSGEKVEVEGPGPVAREGDPLLTASVPELRGIFAKILLKRGRKREEVAEVGRASVRQMYRDLGAAEAILAQVMGL